MTATAGAHGAVRSGVFRFDPAHPLFEDHFPGAPVVPGSCIVQAFADEAARWVHEQSLGDVATGPLPDKAWAAPVLHPIGPIREVRGFRFRRFVTPGDYAFRMECTDGGLRCSLHALPREAAETKGHGPTGHGAALPDAAETTAGTAPSAPASPPLLVTGMLAW